MILLIQCETCRGQGRLRTRRDFYAAIEPCEECEGSGSIPIELDDEDAEEAQCLAN